MTENNSDEIIRVENLEKNEYVVNASVVNPPQVESDEKSKKINVFNVFLSAFSRKASDEKFLDIRPVMTVKLAILSLISGLLLYIFYRLTSLEIILPLIIIFSVSSFPLFILSFIYEINPEKKATIFQIFLSLTLGILLYIIINALTKSLLLSSISSYKSTVEVLVVPILWGIGELALIVMLSRVFNITDQLTSILIAVALGLGYAFMQSLNEFIAELMIPFSTIINEGEAPSEVMGFINDAEIIEKIFKDLSGEVLTKVVLINPLLIGCWSVVIGNLAPIANINSNRKKVQTFPAYFLIVLIIVLYMLSLFSATLQTFSAIIKIITLALTLYISIRLLNGALVRTFGDNS